tara:strand:+ start:841 stop:987 length:147 start_codon:yes stop_codon:yes gene_type:complete
MDDKPKVSVNKDVLAEVLKKYKKIKKFQRSNLGQIKKMDRDHGKSMGV